MHEWNNIKLCFRKQILDRNQKELAKKRAVTDGSSGNQCRREASAEKKNPERMVTREREQGK